MRVQILVTLICLSSVFATTENLSAQHVEISRAMLESYMTKPDKDLFKVFHFTFAKSYSLNSEEAMVRYKLFKKAVKFIKKHNARNLSWTVGLNQFADMTNEEYDAHNGITPEMLRKAEREHVAPRKDDRDEPEPVRGLKFLSSEKKTFLFDELAQKVDDKVKHDCDEDKEKNDDHSDDSDGCDEKEEENDDGGHDKITNRDYFHNLTDVRNQGGCGSCWAFATTCLLEAGYNFNNKLTGDNRVAPFSNQQLVDCDPKSSGCSGGWMPYALEQLKKQGGIAAESNYAYKAVAGNCDAAKTNGLVKLKGKGYTGCAPYFGLNKCTREIFWTLMNENPCSVAIDTKNSEFKYYQSGIMDISKTSGCGNVTHAVMAFAWKHQKDDNNTIREYLSVRNSWGNRWGEQGDFRIYYDEKSETCKVTQFCIQPDWA